MLGKFRFSTVIYPTRVFSEYLYATFLYNRSYYGFKISDFQLQNPSEQIRVDSACSRISRNCGYAVLQVGFL